jgi:drug/metabolite transporter (DMT)-like permease
MCYIWWNKVMEELGVLKSSYYLYVNPVASALVSILFMDEQMNFSIALGLILILAGVVWSERK